MLEVTNRCNMSCHLCYSDANQYCGDVSISEIRRRLVQLLDLTGSPIPVQISGGEPTVRDDLPEIVSLARGLGYRNIEIITNGINLCRKPDLLPELKEKGVTAVFLQFDGMTKETYLAIRGQDMTEIRHRALEAVRNEHLCCTLAVALTRGINDGEVGEIVGRINGTYGEADWTPIRYVNRPYSRTALSGLYRGSRVALVTPFYDGMNLVAKEFVAAQNPEDPGVLILSRFAGAARELERALLINPFDSDAVSSAITRALHMPLEERKERYQAMFEVILRNDVGNWAKRFIDALQHPKGVAHWTERPLAANDRIAANGHAPLAVYAK